MITVGLEVYSNLTPDCKLALGPPLFSKSAQIVVISAFEVLFWLLLSEMHSAQHTWQREMKRAKVLFKLTHVSGSCVTIAYSQVKAAAIVFSVDVWICSEDVLEREIDSIEKTKMKIFETYSSIGFYFRIPQQNGAATMPPAGSLGAKNSQDSRIFQKSYRL